MSAKKATQKSAKSTTATDKKSKGFTDEERAAMKERAQELKAAARRGRAQEGGRGKRRAREDRRDAGTGSRHGQAAPCDHQSQRAGPLAENLVRDARVCQGRQGRLLLPKRAEVQTRYATFGFSDTANLDEGAMWPTAFALKELTAAEEARIGALVKKAVS